MDSTLNALPTIEDVMRQPVTISEDTNLRTVLELMIEQKSNSILVLDSNGKLKGEVNVLALIRAVLPEYIEEDDSAAHFATEEILIEDIHQVASMPVIDFMKTELNTLSRTSTFMDAAVIAIASDQGRIPIVDDAGHPIGVVTRTEIKQIIGSYLGIPGCFNTKD